MRFASFWLSICALLCTSGMASPARAQGIAQTDWDGDDDGASSAEVITEAPSVPGRDALAHNAELLDELFMRSMEQTIVEQKFAAAAGITGGMIMLGLSAWRLIENDPQSQYSRGLGVMFMTLGMADLTTGVYAATRIPHEKHRIERWEKAREDGITEIELAHFEGEFQSSRETREGERLLLRWNGLTHALAGLLILAFSPIPDSMSRTDRVSGYIVGGLFFAVGSGTFGASFRKTPSERAWEDYKQQKMPSSGHELSWRFAPSIHRRGAGLSVGGTF